MLELKNILSKLFKYLDNNDIKFCIIGNYESLPDYTNHDVDIWTDQINLVRNLLIDFSKKVDFKIFRENVTANGYNIFFGKISVNDVQILHFDVMHETAYRSFIPIVTKKIIIQNIQPYKSFFIVNKNIEAIMHLLYPLIQNGSIKEKYKKKLFEVCKHIAFKNNLSLIIGKRLTKRITDLILNKEWNKIEKLKNKIIRKIIIKMIITFNPDRIEIIFRFVISLFKRFLKSSGVFLAFVGPDGIGKSTIIEKLKEIDSEFLMKGSKSFYWRPNILPKLSNLLNKKNCELERYDDNGLRIIDTTPKNKIISIFKYFYYLFDFILGSLYIRYHLSRGRLIFFDRYFHDLLIYPQRFNLEIPKIILFFCIYLIKRPDIVILLELEPEKIVQRKKELSIDELKNQYLAYKLIINKYENLLLIDNSSSPNQVVCEILKETFLFLANRLSHG